MTERRLRAGIKKQAPELSGVCYLLSPPSALNNEAVCVKSDHHYTSSQASDYFSSDVCLDSPTQRLVLCSLCLTRPPPHLRPTIWRLFLFLNAKLAAVAG